MTEITLYIVSRRLLLTTAGTFSQVRLTPGSSPTRVVLDGQLRTPLDARVIRRIAPARAGAEPPPSTVVLTLQQTLDTSRAAARADELRRRGVRVLGLASAPDGRVCLRSALAALRGRLGLRSVMVEGGAAVIGRCLTERAANRVVLTLAPTLAGGLRPQMPPQSALPPSTPPPSPPLAPLSRVQAFSLGDDVVIDYAIDPLGDRAEPRSRL